MKTLLSFFIVICTTYSSTAQDIELAVIGGYTFADRVPISGGSAHLEDSGMFGGTLSYGLNEFYAVEFFYSRQPTTVRASSVLLTRDYDGKAAISYFLLGPVRMIPTNNPAVKVFSGLKLGMVVMDARNRDYDSVTRLAANAELGVRYEISEIVGIRLGSTLNFPIVNSGASLWWSSSSGANVGVSSWSSITQFNVQGALYIKFKRDT